MKRFVLAALATLITGCGSDAVMTPTTQEGLLSSDPVFLRFSDKAAAAAPQQASFWAVKGESRSLVLRYGDSGQEFLRFTVGAAALSRRPDGSEFAAGDSVLISVAADPGGALAFRFSPSGLKFDDDQPAVLRMSYARANPDYNRDGAVNLFDSVAALQIGVWKQELPLLPWLKIPSLNLFGDVVRADVHDFTGFGMAVN